MDPLTEAEFADWDERSAILEFDAGLTREEAERQALLCIINARARQYGSSINGKADTVE